MSHLEAGAVKDGTRWKILHSTVHTKCSTVLLKADTGADVNLMNRHSTNSLVRPRTFCNQLLSGWKTMEIQQLKCLECSMCFWNGRTMCTDNCSMSLIVTGHQIYSPVMLVTHLEFLSLFTLWKNSLELVRIPHTLHSHKWHPSMHQKLTQKLEIHFFIRKWKELWKNCLTIPHNILFQRSNFKVVHWQRTSLKPMLTFSPELGSFQKLPYKFQLKPNAKPARHAPRKVPIHLQDAFHEEIRNLEQLWILEETKDVTEWVNSFVIVEKKLPINSSNSHSPGHSVNKKLGICLDPET